MTVCRADYLLRHFPALWGAANTAVEDAVEGGSHGDMTGPGRHSYGAISDTVGNRAVALAEAKEAKVELESIKAWINQQLPERDRPLLIAVWRYSYLGWNRVSQYLRLEVTQCRRQWDNLVQNLAVWTRT